MGFVEGLIIGFFGALALVFFGCLMGMVIDRISNHEFGHFKPPSQLQDERWPWERLTDDSKG